MDDLIDRLGGIAPASPLAALRAGRPGIRDHVQGTYRELLFPPEPGGVSRAERAGLAAAVAAGEGDRDLAAHFATLNPADAEEGRMPHLRRFARAVAEHPGHLGQTDIDRLREAGLSPGDVVAVTQLAAFVPFQARLLAGLRAVNGAERSRAPLPEPARKRFTAAEVGWTPRLPPVDPGTATPAQLAALDACPPAQRRSTYFLTLAQDPGSLGERGALFNAVMYAPRGLPRAERELATAVVSMVNGCVYCCSVHARRFVELSKDDAFMQALLDGGFGIAMPPRRRAIVDFSARLTAQPGAVGAADVAPLRAAGLEEGELLDLVHAAAMFANANRLMQALGETDA